MSTYKELKGINVQSLDADPTAVEGDVWYNASTAKLKMYTYAAGTWASGGNLNTARQYVNQGAGLQTAALCTGGYTNPPQVFKDEVESYDGSSWTEVADINTARSQAGATGGNSPNTAALIFGGYSTGNTFHAHVESWDGSSWTEIADLNTERYGPSGGGTQTAAIAAAGEPTTARTEIWDGSSWTEVGDQNDARASGQGEAGTSTSFILAGGAPGHKDVSETWDGTSWTEGNNLNTGRFASSGMGQSVPTAHVTCGQTGGGRVAITEAYDGTSWAEVADVATARSYAGSTGTGNAGILFSGSQGPGGVANTYEWTSAIAAQTIAFD